MELIIENPDNEDYDDFAVWLCVYLRDNAFDVLPRNPELEEVWDQYFKDNDLGWQRNARGDVAPPNVNLILHTYFEDLEVNKIDADYVISCNKNARLRGTYIDIDAIATMITEGVLTIPRYPYIDEVFDAVADGIEDLYGIYLEEADEDDSEEGE